MKALVTGGAGFIGGHLVDALIARGDDVTVIDKADPIPERKNAKATYVKMDINDAGLLGEVKKCAPHVVFHLAAHIDDRASVLDPVFTAEENIKGSLEVFQACREARVKKIVFASTSVAYGNTDALLLSEDMTPKPVTPYAISKFAGELYLQFAFRQYSVPFVALRIGNVYGPWQDGSKEVGAIAIFISMLLKGKAPFMNNDGKTVRDYIHVTDVVSGMLAAAERGQGVVNLGTGVGTETAELYRMIAEEIPVNIAPIPRPEVPDLVKRVCLDPTKAQKELQWEARVRLSDGIEETVAWYKARV